MKTKLKACEKYEDIRDTQDTTKLLILLKEICYNFQDVKYAPSSIHSAMEKFINWKQSEDMSNQRYLVTFNGAVQELKHSVIVMNVSELITKQEHGDIKKK